MQALNLRKMAVLARSSQDPNEIVRHIPACGSLIRNREDSVRQEGS